MTATARPIDPEEAAPLPHGFRAIVRDWIPPGFALVMGAGNMVLVDLREESERSRSRAEAELVRIWSDLRADFAAKGWLPW